MARAKRSNTRNKSRKVGGEKCDWFSRSIMGRKCTQDKDKKWVECSLVDPKVPGVYSNCTESVDDKGKKVLVITEPVSTDEIVQEAVATPEPIIEPTNNQPALNTSYPQPQQPNYGMPQQPNYGMPQQPNYGMPQQPNYGMPHQPNYGGKRRPRKIGGRKSKRKSSGKRKNIQSKKNRK